MKKNIFLFHPHKHPTFFIKASHHLTFPVNRNHYLYVCSFIVFLGLQRSNMYIEAEG